MRERVVATDGKLVGLYVIAKYYGSPWPFRIVGKTHTDFICDSLKSVDDRRGCVKISRIVLHSEIRINRAELFANEADCLARYNDIEAEEIAEAEKRRRAREAFKAKANETAKALKLTKGEITQWSALYRDEYDTITKEMNFKDSSELAEVVSRQRFLRN